MRRCLGRLKWVALIVVVILTTAYIGSHVRPTGWRGRTHSVGLTKGVGWSFGPFTWPPQVTTGLCGCVGSTDGQVWRLHRSDGSSDILVNRWTSGYGGPAAPEYHEMRLELPILAAAAGAGLFWWLGRRAIRPHTCVRCGYDLTGIPPQGRVCPECGTISERDDKAKPS